MHDNLTVVFDIKSPFTNERGYKNTLITIWHRDPETDGTDDSCGWFMRSRHGDQAILEKIRREFAHSFKNSYWFTREGEPIFSTIGTLIDMYNKATWIYFNYNRRRRMKFMRKHLFDIIHFAENPIDCIGDTITNKYGRDSDEEVINQLTSAIFSDILNKQRRWYQHPRWHIWHWEIQFVFLRAFRHKPRNKNVDQNLRSTV